MRPCLRNIHDYPPFICNGSHAVIALLAQRYKQPEMDADLAAEAPAATPAVTEITLLSSPTL